MKYINISSQIKRKFHKKSQRFECQFRIQNENAFQTECTIDNIDEAMSYVSLVVRYFDKVEAGKVVDNETQGEIFNCQCFVDPEPYRPFCLREAPPAYAQLVMTGIDPPEARKNIAKRKKELEATFAKLRQLHDELNAQLYTSPTERPTVQSPADAAEILECFIANLDHEEMWIVNLDSRNRVMGLVALYKGSVNMSQVRVSEVFRQAIVDNSLSIIVAHNHPSGDPTPSPDDVALTRGIVQAGKLLDIDVLDHLVIGNCKYVSLKERGLGF